MSEPAIILNVDNYESAQGVFKDAANASDRDLRKAIRFYRADNAEQRRRVNRLNSLIEYNRNEGYGSGRDELVLEGVNKSIENNSRKLKTLNAELKKRRV